MSWIVEVGKSVVAPSVFIAAAAWVAKSIASQALSKDIEAYKHRLERENTESKIRYEKLYARRAEVVAELYKRLTEADRCISDYMKPLQLGGERAIEEKRIDAINAMNELLQYTDSNRLYFNEQLLKKIDAFLNDYRQNFSTFDLSQQLGGEDMLTMWIKAWEKHNKEFINVRRALEKDFRNYLGDTD